jgi:hypothetical protein
MLNTNKEYLFLANKDVEYEVGDVNQFLINGDFYICQVIYVYEGKRLLKLNILQKLEEPLYKLSEIKKAFWKTFHKQGELFFNYIEPGDNEYFSTPEESTNGYWGEFLYNLQDN